MPDEPRKGSLLVIFLTVFIDLLGFGMVLPLLPIYGDVFTEDPLGWRLGLLMASFSMMQFLFAPVWGRLSDQIGRRPVLMIGLGGSVVFYTLFGVATSLSSLPLLFVSRIGAGIAGATIPTAHAYIADSTSVEGRSKGMALIGTAFGLGFTFGPVLAFLAVPTGRGDPGPWPGYAAAILSAVALVLAVFKLPESKRADSESAARKLFDVDALRQAIARPSIGMLLMVVFLCIFTFAKLETSSSILIWGNEEATDSPFRFTWAQVCWTHAYIGFTLAAIQGGLVRRLAGRIAEGKLATFGAAVNVAGFAIMVAAIKCESVALLLASLAVVVAGVSFIQPNLNSLLSRRSDPNKQGVILGAAQSVNALGRILGSGIGIPLLRMDYAMPSYVGGGLMAVVLVLVIFAARGGKDFPGQ
ncbi:MAG: MFS transporter [Pirellulaceae bacterium]|nr:MFS transporter [Pirellulaceae bacterium]